jgi:hypothetical protein
MKIRSGFVSNSSSSSFVILLPENFLEIVDYDKITDGDEDFPLDTFKELLKKLIDENGLYNYDIYEYIISNDVEDYDLPDSLNDVIRPYIIAEVEGGPDEGQIIIADTKKINEILKKK